MKHKMQLHLDRSKVGSAIFSSRYRGSSSLASIKEYVHSSNL